jgi:hypothetical protein
LIPACGFRGDEDPFYPNRDDDGAHWAWSSVGIDLTRCYTFHRDRQIRPLQSLMIERTEGCVISLFADEQCEDAYRGDWGPDIRPAPGQCVELPIQGQRSPTGSYGEGPLSVKVDCRSSLLKDYAAIIAAIPDMDDWQDCWERKKEDPEVECLP